MPTTQTAASQSSAYNPNAARNLNQGGTLAQARQNQMAVHNAAGTPSKKKQPSSLNDYLKLYEREICKALPKQIDTNRYIRICTSALTSNTDLKDCTPQSFIGAVLQSAALGLEPNTPMGYAYLIPYYNKGKKECQFQIGYKGLVQLVRNSGEISTLKAETVYEKDIFSYSLGLHADLTHIPFTPTPEDMDRGEPIAYYAYYKTRDGDFDFVVAYKPEMLAFRDQYVKKDRNGNIPLASPWNKNFDEMAKKTLIKRVLKLAPLSPMIQERVQSDSTIKSMNFSDHMMDANALFSMNDETVYDAEFEEAEPLEITPNGAFQEEAVSEGA